MALFFIQTAQKQLYSSAHVDAPRGAEVPPPSQSNFSDVAPVVPSCRLARGRRFGSGAGLRRARRRPDILRCAWEQSSAQPTTTSWPATLTTPYPTDPMVAPAATTTTPRMVIAPTLITTPQSAPQPPPPSPKYRSVFHRYVREAFEECVLPNLFFSDPAFNNPTILSVGRKLYILALDDEVQAEEEGHMATSSPLTSYTDMLLATLSILRPMALIP